MGIPASRTRAAFVVSRAPMSQHKATICWSASTPEYMSGKYSREHTWTFDGGLSVPASSSPTVVRVPLSNPANVDPEEAYVAWLEQTLSELLLGGPASSQ